MVPRVWSLMRFLIKGSVAGGAVYLVYDQELLGPSDKSQAVLQKAEEVVPPAMYQFSQYVCEQTGLKIPQLPAPPKFNFHIRDTWNSGRPWSLSLGGWLLMPPSLAPLTTASWSFLSIAPLAAPCSSHGSKRGQGVEISGRSEQDGASFEDGSHWSSSCDLRQEEALPHLCLSFPVWNCWSWNWCLEKPCRARVSGGLVLVD
uniref:MICOS complex subunit MIC13 n=1 Tax=Ursus americanus TaxID=9643 RepID=A0A452SHU1_URSAM